MSFGFSFLTAGDWIRFESLVKKYALQVQGSIVSSAQNVINAVTSEISGLGPVLTTLLTEVENLVNANPQVDTTALQSAADSVVTQVNAVAAAAEAPPVVTPPTP